MESISKQPCDLRTTYQFFTDEEEKDQRGSVDYLGSQPVDDWVKIWTPVSTFSISPVPAGKCECSCSCLEERCSRQMVTCSVGMQPLSLLSLSWEKIQMAEMLKRCMQWIERRNDWLTRMFLCLLGRFPTRSSLRDQLGVSHKLYLSK